MGRFARPCLKCGVLTSGDSYCAEHKPVKIRNESAERKAVKRERYDSTYKRLSKWVRENTEVCHICGGGWRADDPWEADPLDPGNPDRKYDLAGTYSLSPQSIDERIARDVLFHRLAEVPAPDNPFID